MNDRESSGIAIGRLQAGVESLSASMLSIAAQVAEQQATIRALTEQIKSAETKITDLKILITGPDGAAGLMARLQTMESAVEKSVEDLADIKRGFADTKKILIRFAIIVGSSGALGTAGMSKLMSLLGG